MMTARTKILKHIWERGGGYINSYNNITLVTKIALKDVRLYVDVGDVTIERYVHNGENVALLRGLACNRGKVYFHNILTGICIDNRFYVPINKSCSTTRLPNGEVRDTYSLALAEQYVEDDKQKKTKK